MARIFNLSILISILAHIIFCSDKKDCNLINDSFNNYKHAFQVIKSSDFKYSDGCNTGKGSWIYDTKYYSCDGKIGYLLVETKSRSYIYSGVPIDLWNEFKNADSFGKFYNRNLKGQFQLT